MQARTPPEGDPPSVTGGLAAPARRHHQTTGDGEGNDAQDDEEQGGDPLRGQLWGGTVPVSAVDGLAPQDQAYSQRAWIERERECGLSDPLRVARISIICLWQEQTVGIQMKQPVL